MTGDQMWGAIGFVVGIAIILLRKYLFLGGQEVDRYKPDNNLANPNRKDTAPEDQRIIVVVGLVFMVAGFLYLLKILPRG